MDSNPIFKRVKERSVWEAKEKVDRWRELFEEGIIDQAGKTIRLTLKQAAEYVGIPKKTLEDYHQLLRKVSQITPLQNLKDRKMGYLRQFLKENKGKDTSEQFSYNEQFEQQDAMMEQEQPQEDDDNIENLEQMPPGPFYYEEIQQQQHAEPQTPQQEFFQVAAPGNWEDMIVEGPTAPYNCEEEIEMAFYHRLQESRNPFYGRNFYDETTQFRTHTINYLIIQTNFLPEECEEDSYDEKAKYTNTKFDETDFDSEPEIYQLDTDDED